MSRVMLNLFVLKGCLQVLTKRLSINKRVFLIDAVLSFGGRTLSYFFGVIFSGVLVMKILSPDRVPLE